MKLIHRKEDGGMSRPRDFFSLLDRDFDSLFSNFFGPSRFSLDRGEFMPSLDVKEGKDEITVKADLPGMDKKDIRVEVKDGVLSLSGERHEEKDAKEGGWTHSERSWGSFYRSVRLPDAVKEDKIKAEYKDGVLTVRLTKDEATQPKTITIE